VTNVAFLGLKKQLLRSLADHQHPPTNIVSEISTNAVVKTNAPASK
jgi:hypothetical protein